MTVAAGDHLVISAAKQVLDSYPGARAKPSASDLQKIQDALWWIESQGVQRISNVTRYRIAEKLEGIHFWGRLTINDLVNPVLPARTVIERVVPGSDGFLYEDRSDFVFQAFFSGAQLNPPTPKQVSVLDYLKRLGLTEWPDERFCLFIERIVHPEVQPPDTQQKLVARLNAVLQQDSFELRREDSQGGVPVYKLRRIGAGVSGSPKYIIFASIGPKPDIVIEDAINMDIRVVRYSDQCLIYDQPPPNNELTWQMLVEWWGKTKAADLQNTDVRRDLGLRLRASLQSEPERTFFDTYFKTLRPRFGINLPALLPQVYLHYDPRNRSERAKPVLVHQRMDFLMLLRNATRIVIEIDGVQHYASDDGHASTSRYAEMVTEDRRIRLLGYEVYRFGGAEFVNPEQASSVIVKFFNELFDRHGIQPES
jgi:very-short-patch-repair endonuclease